MKRFFEIDRARVRFYYPNFTTRAVTFSYDDGPIDTDLRVIEILDRYGLKGTFNLMSQWAHRTARKDCGWDHLGQPIRFSILSRDEIPSAYAGHEIACHGFDHLSLAAISENDAALDHEICDCLADLRELTDVDIRGYAYPGGTPDCISPSSASALEIRGIRYARTAQDSKCLTPPKNLLHWDPTCHDHTPYTRDLIENFLSTDAECALLFIWGHSYELTKPDRDGWGNFERICATVSQASSLWRATNLEICEYLRALYEVYEEGGRICNPSRLPIYLSVSGSQILLRPGESISSPSP